MKRVIKITKNLEFLRDEIDKIDKEIVDLIKKRASLVTEVGKTKLKEKKRIYVPEREVNIFKKLSDYSDLSTNDIKNFYTEIISFCRKFEKILDVGVYNDTVSLVGLKKIFGEYVNPVYLNSNKLDTSNLNYILTYLSKETIEFIQNNDWQIINMVKINDKNLYLISSFKNELLANNDTLIILSNNAICDNFLLIENNLYINKVKYFELEKINHLDFKILGSIPCFE